MRITLLFLLTLTAQSLLANTVSLQFDLAAGKYEKLSDWRWNGENASVRLSISTIRNNTSWAPSVGLWLQDTKNRNSLHLRLAPVAESSEFVVLKAMLISNRKKGTDLILSEPVSLGESIDLQLTLSQNQMSIISGGKSHSIPLHFEVASFYYVGMSSVSKIEVLRPDTSL